ncbi:MAG: hypothetical protein ACUVQ8_06545 [Nitrososphaeria archaeon]
MPNSQAFGKDWKYEVTVQKVEKALKVPESVLDEVKGIKGKMYSQMKKEKIDCPVLGKELPFLVCFVCPNFRSRIRGIVYCKGGPL